MGEGNQFLSLFIHHPYLFNSISFAVVHVATTIEERKALWSGLLRYKSQYSPWLVCGDFNVVVVAGEKKWGWPFKIAEAFDFVELVGTTGLVDGGF